MSGEDRFAEWMRREAAEYNRLPEPAPEATNAMWRRIEGAVGETVASYGEGVSRGDAEHAEKVLKLSSASPREMRGRRSSAWWAAGIAAALVMGIGVGRWSAPVQERVVIRNVPATVLAARTPDSVPAAVVDHLAASVVFLASFREEASAGAVDGAVRDRGRDLLTATQILMDSPAANDPRMRTLLEDLELVLVQIAHLNRRRGVEEARIASEAMKQNDILPRLRTVVPQDAIDESAAAMGSGNED